MFSSDRSGVAQTWVANADGTSAVALARTTNGILRTAEWSPDGRQIAFGFPEEGANRRYVVDARGGSPRRLPVLAQGGWTHDGKSLYGAQHRNGWNIFRFPIDGSEPVQLTFAGGSGGRESPDGKYLYYGKRMDLGPSLPGAPNTLMRMPLDAGERKAEEVVPAILSTFTLAPTNQGVYYMTPVAAGRCEIRFWNAATRQSSLIWKLDKRPEAGMSVSPDGRHLLFSEIDREQSELMLVENFRY